jgi:hypothetical protein
VAHVSFALSEIRSAEDAIKLYLHLRDGGDQARSLTQLESQEVCGRTARDGICGGKRSSKGKRGRETTICAKCGEPWQSVTLALARRPLNHRRRVPESEVVRVKGDRSVRLRRYGLAPVESAAYLRPVFEWILSLAAAPDGWSTEQWKFDLAALWICTFGEDGKGCGVARGAELGLRLHASLECPSRWWTPHKVMVACERARAEIEGRLEEARRGGWRWKSIGLGARSRSRPDSRPERSTARSAETAS